VAKYLTLLGYFWYVAGLSHRDRKAANAHPRCKPHGVGDRPRRAGNADFTDAFNAQRIHVGVGFLDQDGLE